MSIALRALLIIGALVTLLFMLLRVRAAKVQIRDSIPWILWALLLLALSIFPNIAIRLAFYLEVASPINVVFLVIIFLLLVKQFSDSLRISRLDTKIQQLAQRIALDEKARGTPHKNEEKPAGLSKQ
jgi:hypothetical protein